MKVLIFGATGKIGLQAIELIKQNPDLTLVGFSFFNNLAYAKKIKKAFGEIEIFSLNHKQINTVSSYKQLIIKTNPDIILNSIIGFAGLEVSLLAVEHGIDLALANKETIITAGKFICELAKQKQVNIYPVDSEHSSLYQTIKYLNNDHIKAIYITASGGKFWNQTQNLQKVTYNDVIIHQNWDMGAKISIDSSTMLNKFFELVEANYFFDFKVHALYQKQSLVHSIIQLKDNSFLFHCSVCDMKYAIFKALTKFNSYKAVVDEIDFTNLILHFDKIDSKKWLPIKWAEEFVKTKNLALPIIVNAADEVLINLFKHNKITFNLIVPIIDQTIKVFIYATINNINDIYHLHNDVQNYILKNITNFNKK